MVNTPLAIIVRYGRLHSGWNRASSRSAISNLPYLIRQLTSSRIFFVR